MNTIQKLGHLVARLEQAQQGHPGYCAEIMTSIVNSEIRKIERESGVTLDDLREYITD